MVPPLWSGIGWASATNYCCCVEFPPPLTHTVERLNRQGAGRARNGTALDELRRTRRPHNRHGQARTRTRPTRDREHGISLHCLDSGATAGLDRNHCLWWSGHGTRVRRLALLKWWFTIHYSLWSVVSSSMRVHSSGRSTQGKPEAVADEARCSERVFVFLSLALPFTLVILHPREEPPATNENDLTIDFRPSLHCVVCVCGFCSLMCVCEIVYSQAATRGGMFGG